MTEKEILKKLYSFKNKSLIKKFKMNILNLLAIILNIVSADLIGFNRLGNNVYSFKQSANVYAPAHKKQPRFKMTGRNRRSLLFKRYLQSVY